MKIFRIFIFCIKTACLALLGFPAQANILDQQNNNMNLSVWAGVGNSPGYPGSPDISQSFTTSISGILDSVDIFVLRQAEVPLCANLSVEIFAAYEGLPIGSSLANVTIPELSVPLGFSFFNVDFHYFSISVDVGTQFAILLHNDVENPNTIYETAANNGSYTGGTFGLDIGGGFYSIENYDLLFKTYVSTVPIPASIYFLVSGLFFLNIFRKPNNSGRSRF